MHCGLEEAVRPFDHAVTEIDDGAARLWLHVLPVFFLILSIDWEDLEAAKDVEEGGDTAKIGVRDEACAAVLGRLGVVFEDADLVAGELIKGMERGHRVWREAKVGFKVSKDKEFEVVVVGEEGFEEGAGVVDDFGGRKLG